MKNFSRFSTCIGTTLAACALTLAVTACSSGNGGLGSLADNSAPTEAGTPDSDIIDDPVAAAAPDAVAYPAASQVTSPDGGMAGTAAPGSFWKCLNKVDGDWAFGRVPFGCDASAFGDDSHVRTLYGNLIFNDQAASRDHETARYIQEMYAVIREAAAYYIRDRKPSVGAAEVHAWQEAVFAIAYQETYWSQYRLASDNRLKMMRGDSGHGHGMMQLDDRYHFADIKGGKGWDLVKNLFSALDIYYDGWKAGASASCVKKAKKGTQWQAQARAAYSAYNGGPAQICRWTKKKGAWVRNDKGFYAKLTRRDWADHVNNSAAASSVDIGCALGGSGTCAKAAMAATGDWTPATPTDSADENSSAL